jgi:hypothetical protein
MTQHGDGDQWIAEDHPHRAPANAIKVDPVAMIDLGKNDEAAFTDEPRFDLSSVVGRALLPALLRR